MKKAVISKNLLFLITLLLILITYVVYVFFPLKAKIDEMNREHELNRIMIKTYENELLEKEKLQNGIADMGKRADEGVRFLGGDKFTDQISIAAVKTGVTLDSVSVEDKNETITTNIQGFTVNKYEARVSFKADETRLLNYLKYFEDNTQAAFYIDNISMTGEQCVVGISMYCPAK